MKKKINIQRNLNYHKEKSKQKKQSLWTFRKLHQRNNVLAIQLVNKLIFNPVCAQKITKIIQKQPSKQLIAYTQLQKSYTGQEHMIKLYSFLEIKSIISNVIKEKSIKNIYRFVDFKLQHYTITNKYVIDLQKLFKINKQRQEKNDSKLSTKSGENKILIDLYPQKNQKKLKSIKKKKKPTSQKVQLQILTENIQEMIRNIRDNRKLQVFKMQMESKRIFNAYKLKNMFEKSRQQQFKKNIDKDILKLQKNSSSHKKMHKLPTQRLQTNPDPQFQEYGLSIIRQNKYYDTHHKKKKSKSKQRFQHNYFIQQRQNNKSIKKLSNHKRINTQRSQVLKDKYSRMPTEYDSTVIIKTNKSKDKIRDVYSPCFNKIKSKSKSKSNFSQSKSKQKMTLKFKPQKK